MSTSIDISALNRSSTVEIEALYGLTWRDGFGNVDLAYSVQILNCLAFILIPDLG